MRKLLFANFGRLRKSKVFWSCLGSTCVFGIAVVLNNFSSFQAMGYSVPIDRSFFTHTQLIGVLCAVFSSLFTGTEYSDGTIRNKLVVGHSRSAIYLSSFIINFCVGCSFYLAYMLAVALLGFPLLGFFEADMGTLSVHFAAGLAMTLAFSGIFTALGMLIHNRSIGATMSLLGIFALLFLSIFIYSRLSEPEMWEAFTVTGSGGQSFAGTLTANPYYLRGFKREVFEFFNEFLPTGQSIQLAGLCLAHPVREMLYSLFIALASTLLGLLCFKRKNIS